MAISGKVYGKNQFSIGIKNKAVSAFETPASPSTTYLLLPVTEMSYPNITLVESGEIKTNNSGMIELKSDQFRTRKGGSLTLDFELPAERDLLVRLMANVLQDHAEDATDDPIFGHEVEASSGSPLSRPVLSSTATANSAGIPSLFDIALFYPGSSEDKLITSATLQSLTLNFDQADGRCLVSGTFYSGFTSDQTLLLEQNVSADPDVVPQTFVESFFNTKTLDLDGSADQDLVLTAVSFTFNNNVTRVGRDANGDPEAYAWGIPNVEITGEVSFMYDEEFAFGSAKNVMQDFLDGVPATLTLVQGDGTLTDGNRVLGEMKITAEIYSTAVNIDAGADVGSVITIPFKVIQPVDGNGDANGTAFKFEYVDSKSNTTW
jgi:hypothetical protein